MEAILIALATAFNAIIIKWKFEHKRYEDVFLDILTLTILASLFSGSMGGMIIATMSSAFVSLYLLISPPKFTTSIETKKFIDEFKKRMPQ